MSEEAVVLVTGVSGYLGSHVAKLLLEEGYKVRGTVRSLENEAKLEPLKNLVPDAKFPLELVAADLTKDEGWDKAVEGCSGIMHVASPFPDVTNKVVAEEELIGPAKDGSLRLLKAAAAHANTVKRVVLTSSFASVCGEPVPEPDKEYNEESWTDAESPTIDAYTKSKAIAEKAAWDFVKELPDDQKFELAVINPTLILGPALTEGHKNATSVSFMVQIVNKVYPGVPRVQMPICDVRDVAKAHLKALTMPEAVNNRHIICTDSVWVKDISMAVAKEFKPQGYSIATGQFPYFACWLLGLFNKGMKNTILPRIGKTIKIDNKRMVEVLGVEPTAIDCTINDMVYSLVDLGIARKAKKYKQAGSRAEVPAVNGEVEEDKKEEKESEDKPEEEGEKKELEPEDKEKKEGKEIKEDKPEQKEDNKDKEEAAKEEKKEETESEK
ncbi:phenylacetaldehyde reductase-like isoform X1 [Homarus americanus]|uniref:phenylacetaldehyde reductase-like isoform X1 n=1 Tax=Homarus americanus TaxID=6706 RepID=UPI001C4498FF|nr:phenylacetaldehyde reductase-like isoform X1 [Homarus americanus]